MKNYHGGKIVFGLFALLFISADVNADAELQSFTYYRQEETNTC